jgi:hypothetical protein
VPGNIKEKGLMKTIRAAALVIAAALGLALPTPGLAGGSFHFPVGLAYSDGAYDAMNDILDGYEADWGASIDNRIVIPVGLTFNPYYEWDFGLGIGIGIGPTCMTFASLENGSGDSLDTKFTFIMPIGMDVRYTLLNKKDISPYVRVGFRYPIAAGDNISSSSDPGVFGAVGVEFWRTKTVGMGVEIAYDDSTVKIESSAGRKSVTFAGFTAAISVVF